MHVASGKSTSLSEFMQLCETASGFLKQSVALPLTTDESIDDELTKVFDSISYGGGVYHIHFSSASCMRVIGCSAYSRSSGKPVTPMTP